MMRRIAVLANSCTISDLKAQTIDDKYLNPIFDICQAVPIIVPTNSTTDHIKSFLDFADGIILTGDESNIDPNAYGGEGTEKTHGPFDRSRDKVAFQLINGALEKQIPLLGICRGMQEINVALGGSLRNDVFSQSLFPKHEKFTSKSVNERYGPAHRILVSQNSLLGKAIGSEIASVNSLHEQALDKLAPDLVAVAKSDDGLIEAVEHKHTEKVIGVQWHAEYNTKQNPASLAAFKIFTQAFDTKVDAQVETINDPL